MPTLNPETNHEVAMIGEMLTYKRPASSKTEEEWLDTFVRPMSNHPNVTEYWGDKAGNLYFEVAGGSKTLFSCHSDTVHRKDGRQKIEFDPVKNLFGKNDGEPLGADNGAGVWMCLEIIKANVPCTVVVHRGEECGGIGSSWIASNDVEFLKGFDRAVAFDRKATDSVITHQSGGRCCSDVFAQALSDGLNEHDHMYSGDDTGSFTDTANYTEVIPECTNVSVGYYSEHTAKETLDVHHLLALRDAVICINWEKLPTARDPSVVEYDFWNRIPTRSSSRKVPQIKSIFDMSRNEMLDLVYEDPDYFVDLVREDMFGMFGQGVDAPPLDEASAVEGFHYDDEVWKGYRQ